MEKIERCIKLFEKSRILAEKGLEIVKDIEADAINIYESQVDVGSRVACGRSMDLRLVADKAVLALARVIRMLEADE